MLFLFLLVKNTHTLRLDQKANWHEESWNSALTVLECDGGAFNSRCRGCVLSSPKAVLWFSVHLRLGGHSIRWYVGYWAPKSLLTCTPHGCDANRRLVCWHQATPIASYDVLNLPVLPLLLSTLLWFWVSALNIVLWNGKETDGHHRQKNIF